MGRWSPRPPFPRGMLVGLLLVLSILGLFLPSGHTLLSQQERVYLRDEAREMFYHSFDKYMEHAYPLDELMPLSCRGRDWQKRDRGTLDDTLGGYALTLIDSLDMLATLGDYDRFYDAVQLVSRDVTFERNVTISLFEATIRVLGGLLSAHSLVEAEELEAVFSHREPKYDGQLLDLAYDLGVRLLPAFDTRTGIPVHRINLMYGVPPQETRETCTAAAGTLILEMGLLSRLTGDYRFERAARRSLKALWDRRSSLNLVGSTIHTQTGRWLQTHSGIGAGIDSFYEYLLKAYIMFGDEEMLEWFNSAYAAVQDHTLWGPWNVEVSMARGKWQPHSFRISALQAFWPSLQVLAGELQAAKVSHRAFYSLWREFDALPDIFDARGRQLITYARDSPLRPELVESTYHLYMATKDPHYLNVGKELLFALQNRTRVACGFASIADVTSERLDDRMDSFFLSETLKYLYLLFDTSLEPAQQSSIFCPLGASAYPAPLQPNATMDPLPPTSDPGSINGSSPSASWAPRPCIPLVRTLFTTEGHIFFVEQERHAKSAHHYLTRTGKLPPGKGRLSRNPPPHHPRPGGPSGPHPSPNARRLRDQGTCAAAAADDEDLDLDASLEELMLGTQSGLGKGSGVLGVLEPFAASDSFRLFEHEVMKVFNTIRIDPANTRNPGLVLQCDENQQTCRIGRLARSPIHLVLTGLDRPVRSADEALLEGLAFQVMSSRAVAYPGNFGPDLRSKGDVVGLLKPPWGSEAESRQFLACEELGEEEAKRLHNHIALVLRGQCSFVTKARNIQKAGAIGVVVLDARGLREEEGEEDEEEGKGAGELFMSWQVMADDGSGRDITIPAAMVAGKQARAVQNLLRASPYGAVVVRMVADETMAMEEEDMVELSATTGQSPNGAMASLIHQKHPLLEGVLLKFAESVQSVLGTMEGGTSPEGAQHNQHPQMQSLSASHEAFGSPSAHRPAATVHTTSQAHQRPPAPPPAAPTQDGSPSTVGTCADGEE